MDNPLFKDDNQYLSGTENYFIRAYFYLSNGLMILNEFRNLFLAIIAIYIAFKWDNIWFAVILFVICGILLTFMGYYSVHKIGKVREWLTTRFSTHFGMKTFNYNEENNKLLMEIRDQLVELNREVDKI